MRKVRSLNFSGIEIFRQWINNPINSPPVYILDSDEHSEELDVEYVIDTDRRFDSTFDIGKYLHEEVFCNGVDVIALSASKGMWGWISLALISSLLAKGAKRKGKPLGVPHYIEIDGRQGRRLGYRLIVRTAWKLVRLHGDAAVVAIGSKRSPWGEMAEQMTSRQEIFAHPGFWAVATKLYTNSEGDLRRGSTSQRPLAARKDPKNTSGRGGVRRLPLTFRQFDRTYHTRNMPLEQVLEVLPKEYEKWLPGK